MKVRDIVLFNIKSTLVMELSIFLGILFITQAHFSGIILMIGIYLVVFGFIYKFYKLNFNLLVFIMNIPVKKVIAAYTINTLKYIILLLGYWLIFHTEEIIRLLGKKEIIILIIFASSLIHFMILINFNIGGLYRGKNTYYTKLIIHYSKDEFNNSDYIYPSSAKKIEEQTVHYFLGLVLDLILLVILFSLKEKILLETYVGCLIGYWISFIFIFKKLIVTLTTTDGVGF